MIGIRLLKSSINHPWIILQSIMKETSKLDYEYPETVLSIQYGFNYHQRMRNWIVWL